MADDRVIHVAVEVGGLHLDRVYEYLPPTDTPVAPGMLVGVGFAGRSVRALVLACDQQPSIASNRLKRISRVYGSHIWANDTERDIFRWAATRFGAPLADVIRHALPKRVIDVERRAAAAGWYPNAEPATIDLRGINPPSLGDYGDTGTQLVQAITDGSGLFFWRPKPGENMGARLTELTLATLAGGRDVLIIVPEPNHEPVDVLLQHVGPLAIDLRGQTSPRKAYSAWLKARVGRARVVIGERGAAFTPLQHLGLTVVFDEANPALKEQRSPRHHTRDVVLERARRANAVGIAVGTVPSATAWRLLRERRLTPITATRDAERDARPKMVVASQNDVAARTRISRTGMAALRHAVNNGTYAVVLAARSGEGRAVVCAKCGSLRRCPACASSLALNATSLHCLGCGYAVPQTTPCPTCRQIRHAPLAAGVSRIATELERNFTVPVVALQGYAQTPPPAPAVVVLTRGSVLTTPPGTVGAVVLPEFSALLRRPTLDAAEDALRLGFTLANWVALSKNDTDGTVVIDADDPEHHAVRAITSWDPGFFWRKEATLRQVLGFPPARYAVRITFPLVNAATTATLTQSIRDVLPAADTLLGPIVTNAADRNELLIKCDDRQATLSCLQPLREAASRDGRDLRVDVDPVTIG
ncbi:MAG: hypothetical protein WD360_05445 [Nitriliruptoraceae bacterium]